MRHITWALLVLVLVGQLFINRQIDQTQRALLVAVYVLESGLTLEQFRAMSTEDIINANARNKYAKKHKKDALISNSYNSAAHTAYAR